MLRFLSLALAPVFCLLERPSEHTERVSRAASTLARTQLSTDSQSTYALKLPAPEKNPPKTARDLSRRSAREQKTHAWPMGALVRGPRKPCEIDPSDPWVSQTRSPRIHLAPEGLELRVAFEALLEILELLALRGLDPHRDLAATIKESCDLLELLHSAAARGHGRSTHTDSARGESRGVAVDRVPVQADARTLAHLLHLGASEAVRPDIPEDKMVVGAIARELVALLFERIREGLHILADLPGVLRKLRCPDLQQLARKSADLVVVGPTLEAREDGHVDALLDVWDLLAVFEEDHPRAGPPERLVRRRRHHVAMRKRRGMVDRGNQA